MGAACCVAAKDRTITDGSPVESLQRHARYSPTWSFRWDNRGRVAGEETHANWLHGGGCANDRMEVKSGTTVETVFASEEGSPIDSFRSVTWQKSPVSEGNGGFSRLPSSDQVMSQTVVEVKESTDSLSVSYPSPVKLSPSVPSVSSMSASPLSSQSHLPPPTSTPSRWHHRSPGHRLLRQVSDSRIPEYKSPTFSISEEPSLFLPPAWGNESSRGSNGGSSDSWSMPAFSDVMTTRRERWSFDSETSGFSRDKITRSSGHDSGSFSSDLQTCGICTKLLTQRSSWGWSSQKIISTNELSVVSVLNCGHVYHAECLESMTPEINKYDPACPVCTFGEKRAVKMSEKALKAELDSKARKRSRKRVVDSDLSSDIMFDRHKSGGLDGRGPKMSSSSSMKSSAGKPFLKRHFSFGSKTSRSMPENQSTPRKSFFWTRSSKG
ncbi:hypothetical protein C2S52_011312 [Perilla frutescens var. hirtella]|uniref:RING-type domain-containing protein n=1 Tax=Perilla frutescens var. hirtella TaxID=608512 RepID=A0AAD4ISE6_PERFH|nr:hypothetical protein C2S52_011312 [Perilla frutescens var. hirtella]KAH6786009.1 hypothetical protein C2S51_038464 [Perilla frutescens var. frutescens]KAH6820311.1 hypothetical protein C2S53_016464 [Perilla frutescens var. hirtella]